MGGNYVQNKKTHCDYVALGLSYGVVYLKFQLR